MALKMVFEPLRIGGIEVPNRIARTAHASGLGTSHISDGMIAYHEARARGGCGLSILEACSVHPSSMLYPLGLFDPGIVDDYRRLMARIRPHGMRVFQQLWHGGNLYPAYDGGPSWAVSDMPGFLSRVGRRMTDAMIWEVVAAYAQAAVHARDGGLDGVEVHAAHGYLPQQFLSTIYNDRTDEWGGSFENRNRFLIEVLRAIKQAAGADFVVGIRLSASDMPGGATVEDNKRVLRATQEAGLIDYVNASVGDYYRMDQMVSGMHSPSGYELPSSGEIVSVATVPRLVTGRIRTLEEADQIIRDDVADLVSMVRQHIADPDVVRKTREGRADEVRPCIGCNQGCWGGHERNGRFGCTVNAAAGIELELSEDQITQTASPKKVLIVGGGPGGMEAARIAALKGHKVTLCEASPALGGTVNIAKKVPKLATIGDIAYWLEQEIFRLGVDVRLNTYMDADDVRAEGADHVILATGSTARLDGQQYSNPGEPARGVELPHVLSSTDAIAGNHTWKETALVLDTVGDNEGLAVMEYLLHQGLKVTYLTPTRSMAPRLEMTQRDGPALERFHQLGDFQILNRHHLVEIQPGKCIVRPLQASHNQTRAVPADHVVLVTHNRPLTEIDDVLREEGLPISLVGDAREPRDILNAIWTGHRAARAIA
ncbi:MAG: NADH:flavin oxidoreductase/NADH oxidase [Sphingomonadales bacterium]|nr:NADH:flavin oxidoreductase/NADH oxidase [Sphingomonadales bacterium]